MVERFFLILGNKDKALIFTVQRLKKFRGFSEDTLLELAPLIARSFRTSNLISVHIIHKFMSLLFFNFVYQFFLIK